MHTENNIFCILLPSNQNFDKQISSQQRGGGVSRVGQWVWMAMEYKIVIPPDMGGTRPYIECLPISDGITIYIHSTCQWVSLCTRMYVNSYTPGMGGTRCMVECPQCQVI